MKALPLLLIASLVANAAWITVTLRHTDSAAAGSSQSSSAADKITIVSANSKTDAPTDIVSALKANDPEALRDLLRAAGVPDEAVRNFVGTAIWSRYRDRMKALQPKPDADKPWWKNDQNNNWFGGMNREQRAEMRSLQREANDESTRILGPNKDNSSWGWQDPRMSFLSDDKRKDFQEIEQDYQDLIQEVQQDMNGFALPSDAEKIRFLQEEKKRDLATILTPTELADYELRMSRTADQLRWKMTRFDGTEEEYRKVFAIQKAYDDTQQTDGYGNPINQGADDWKKRQEAEKILNDQIKAALGTERYTEYSRSQNYEYQQLQAATKRLDLPPETAANVYNLRNDITAQTKLIADNENLAPDQKKQALVDLAKKTRAQVVASLGEEAAGVYIKGGMNWLNTLEQGQVPTFSENGTYNGSRGLPSPKKTTTK